MESIASGHRRVSVAGPGLLLGAGLGGFVDGIVLHQILQWHHMLSDDESSLTVNTLWDGLFHAASWILVVIGMLWLARRLSGTGDRAPMRALIGTLLAGWGLFNLVEGLVDHHLLGIHHVREGPNESIYDLAFLALGAILVAIGTIVYRRATRPETRRVPEG
jgi:uncharacterized membrane protein